jgi:hypothetical protein
MRLFILWRSSGWGWHSAVNTWNARRAGIRDDEDVLGQDLGRILLVVGLMLRASRSTESAR